MPVADIVQEAGTLTVTVSVVSLEAKTGELSKVAEISEMRETKKIRKVMGTIAATENKLTKHLASNLDPKTILLLIVLMLAKMKTVGKWIID